VRCGSQHDLRLRTTAQPDRLPCLPTTTVKDVRSNIRPHNDHRCGDHQFLRLILIEKSHQPVGTRI
jgi:hypothetical protein